MLLRKWMAFEPKKKSLSSVAIKSQQKSCNTSDFTQKDAQLCSKVYARNYQNNVKNNFGKYICQLTMHESCVSQPGTKCSQFEQERTVNTFLLDCPMKFIKLAKQLYCLIFCSFYPDLVYIIRSINLNEVCKSKLFLKILQGYSASMDRCQRLFLKVTKVN